MKMVERIALAIEMDDYERNNIVDPRSFPKRGPIAMSRALAALKAMREPTPEMVAAAEAGDDPGSSIYNEPPQPLPHDEAFTAMIDAAIKEAEAG